MTGWLALAALFVGLGAVVVQLPDLGSTEEVAADEALSDFREVQGHRLPFRVDGGDDFGTSASLPFYRARVTRIALKPSAP